MAATVSGSHTAYCTIDMVENFNTLTTLYSSLPCRWRLLREPPLLCVVCTVPDTPVDPVPQPSVSTTNTAAAFEACRNSVLTGSLITYDNIYYDAQSSFKRIGPVATKSNDLAWEKAISSKQRIFFFLFGRRRSSAYPPYLNNPPLLIFPQTLLLVALTTGPTTWVWSIPTPSSCVTLVVTASCCPSLRSSPHARRPCWPSSTLPPTCRRTSIKERNCQDPCQLSSSVPAPSPSNLSAISSPYPWIRGTTRHVSSLCLTECQDECKQ